MKGVSQKMVCATPTISHAAFRACEMSKRRRRVAAAAASDAKVAREGRCRVLLERATLASMPRQPTGQYTPSGVLLPGGRYNACWAPPVVAIAWFYGLEVRVTV